MPIKSKNKKGIIKEVLREYKKGELNVGKSKKKVKDKDQAIAVAISIANKKKGK